MLNFTYYAPTKLIFGKGEEKNVGSVIKGYGGKKVMVFHYGTNQDFETQLMEKVKASLEEAGLSYILFSGIEPNPHLERAMAAVGIARKEKPDFILAVGGGSVIDTAKYVSVQALYEGNLFADCFMRRDLPVPTERIPLGNIVTVAGTGSEASEACIIKNGNEKRGIDADVMRPVFAIINPELQYSLPQFQTAAGIADTFCHLSESYFTNTPDVFLMDEVIEGIMRAIIRYSYALLENPRDYSARAQIMMASTIANWHLTWCGREDDGAVHFIQEPTSAFYNTVHGAGCAVITLAWMKYVYKHDMARFVRYFTRVWNIPMDEYDFEKVIMAGIERQKQFYLDIGLPVYGEDIGIKKEDIPKLAAAADKRPHGKTGNFVRLGTKEVEDVLRLTLREP